MTVWISNLTVSTRAAAGTVIGGMELIDDTGVSRLANFISTQDSAGFFGITGSNLVTLRAMIPPGFYGVQIYANGENVSLCGEAAFIVTVTAT